MTMKSKYSDDFIMITLLGSYARWNLVFDVNDESSNYYWEVYFEMTNLDFLNGK